MQLWELKNWLAEHEQRGHHIQRMDNGLCRRRGFWCQECDDLKLFPLAIVESDPELVGWMVRNEEDIKKWQLEKTNQK